MCRAVYNEKIFILAVSMIFLAYPILPVQAFIKEVDNTLYNQVLEEYVVGGLVDYERMKDDPRLDEYLKYIATLKPYIMNPKEQLTFWINTYNAYTLKLIKDNYPIKSINQLSTGGLILGSVINKTVWDKFKITIDGREYSLNHIEHEIIRKKFNEPRIHFALVCGAISCPPLRSEAYEADRIDEQLEDQARRFLNDPQKNGIDIQKQELYLSSIFQWYQTDFSMTEEGLVEYVLPYWPENIRKLVEPDIKSWKLRFSEYDWSLNERKW